MSGIDRLQMKVLDRLSSLIVAPSRRRDDVVQFPMRVVRRADVVPGLRRITFAAPEFGDFALLGPDEYFGLLLPKDGVDLAFPDGDRLNVRAAMNAMPEQRRPDLRWYTIRAHRHGEIDVDFVLAGHPGPGGRFAESAAEGDVVGFRAGASAYAPPGTGTELLVGDETAIPAISSILESRPGGGGTRVVIEVADPAVVAPIASTVEPVVLERGGRPGDRVIDLLTTEPPREVGFAWVCGEAGMVARVRKHLISACGVERRRILFSGYWKAGQARD